MGTVRTNKNTCETCGGKLIVSVNSKEAACDNCGNIAEISAEDFSEIKKAYRSAEQKMHLNTVSGYKDAINILQAISFVTEAEEKTLLCEKKLAELKAAQQERDEAKKEKDKKDTLVGVIFFVFFLLLVVLLIAGAAYIIYHLKLGDLSPTAIKVIISVIAVLVILTVIGKLKS